ncbi:hypothetical protein SSX86_012444 [Deinandra increscens subsp. villosa]|uniref:Rhodanese-like domain-containing protein 4, chloroplastic n=1 Tax=Deinandra increscens subsp. villosa TaxID=3103831 RepID=A0AAP0DBX6_9ASTR
MEAHNALVFKPISVLKPEPKKHPSFFPNSKILKPQFHGSSLVLISSVVFNSAFAKALTYEEALKQSTTSSESSFAAPDFDISGIINFAVENPLLLAGGAAVLAVPAILSQVFGKSKPWGVETARIAYEKLGVDGDAQLLDIRASSDIRAVGSPDIRGLKKKPVTVAYNGDDKQGFLKKLSLKFKEPENTTLFILDKFDGSSELVAELVTVNGFKGAYAIKDGAEGSRGWMNSGLPWILPRKSFAFDFGSLDGVLGEGSEAVALLFGVAAATGLSLLAFTEVRILKNRTLFFCCGFGVLNLLYLQVETILEVLGSAALVQLFSKKLLFAEDRKKTLKEVSEFVTTQIGPKELLDDIKDIGKALLPPVTSKALPAPPKEEATNSAPAPAPAAAAPAPAVADPVPAAAAPAPAAAAVAVPPPAEAATPVEQVNEVPKIEVKEEALPKPSRPLSPYPYYPDLKPPSSPSPSRP